MRKDARKQIVTALLLLTQSIFLLAGCGEEEAPVSAETTSKKVAQEKPAVVAAVAVPKKEEAVETAKVIKYIYDPSGKRDPFQPPPGYLAETSKAMPGGERAPDEPPPTPLEMFELSQLKLVAIMVTRQKSVGMVEDPEGKGHTIYLGTLIGKNRGKVVGIEDNKVVIEEKARTLAGTYKTTLQELVIESREENK